MVRVQRLHQLVDEGGEEMELGPLRRLLFAVDIHVHLPVGRPGPPVRVEVQNRRALAISSGVKGSNRNSPACSRSTQRTTPRRSAPFSNTSLIRVPRRRRPAWTMPTPCREILQTLTG